MFTISNVADILFITRLSDGEDEFKVICPFCGDRRGKCTFTVVKKGEIRNVYRCFECGSAGNMLTLYTLIKGLNGPDRFKRAYQEIDTIVPDIQQRNYSRKISLIAKRQKEISIDTVDLKRRDHVYRALISLLVLSKKHREDLRRRGLSEKQIEYMAMRGYKSTDSENSVEIARRLLKMGYNLKGVPGFFINKNDDWEISFYFGNQGYLCPVYNEERLLVAFQIRVDNSKSKSKYTWLTSAKMNKGCSPGSPVSVTEGFQGKTIYVTEGILKADISYLLSNQALIGNPGVGLDKDLRRVLTVLKRKGLEEVWEAYDSDKFLKLKCQKDYDAKCTSCEYEFQKSELECPRKREKRDLIRAGCLKLYGICKDLSLTCRRLAWDLDDEGNWQGNLKGFDDYCAENRTILEQKNIA